MESENFANLPSTSFGSGPDLETRLAALILAGRKQATVWNGALPNETAPGMRWRVTVNGRDVAVIETLSVERRKFREIDEAFAFAEGEGDRSLAFWRAVHEKFFREEGHFTPDMELWCEIFRLVATLDASLASEAASHVAAEEREAADILSASLKAITGG